MEQSVVGLLYTQRQDEKVRRWALNTLARLGRKETSIQAVIHTFTDFADDPQTLASAIAATYKLSPNAPQIVKEFGFDPTLSALAALQHASPSEIDLSGLPLDVETASSDLLKLALVVIGLNRAPVNMLNPRHSNGEMVKALGGHHDPIVSQYSVWAAAENSDLDINDIGIDLSSIESQPPNVRSKLYELIASDSNTAVEYMEYVRLGSTDPQADVRSALAAALRDTYFDGLDAFVIDWFISEPQRLRASLPPASSPITAATRNVGSPASWMTSKPVSRICDSR